jgi:PAS domain S-box-containing protein
MTTLALLAMAAWVWLVWDRLRRTARREALLGQLVERLPVALFAKDPRNHFRFILWNAKAEELFGLPKGRVLHRRDEELFPPDQVAIFRMADTQVLSGVPMVELPVVPFTRGGDIRQLSIHKTALLDDLGKPRLVVGVAMDITERRVLESELLGARHGLAKAQAMAGIGNWEWHPESGEVIWSDQMYALLGLEPGAVPGGLRSFLDRVHPQDRLRLCRSLRRLRGGAERPPADFRVVRPDGSLRFVQARPEVERDAAGRVRRLSGTLQDLTERRTNEEALRQAQKLESLGVLAGGIAHDFNNFLSALGGNLELAQLNLGAASDVAPFLLRIEKILGRCAQLTQQLLAYSGKGQRVVAPLSLNEVEFNALCRLVSNSDRSPS